MWSAARYCGIQGKNDDEVFENFIQALEDLKEKIGIKKTIKDYGVDEKYFLDTLDDMVRERLQRPVHRRQPPLSPDERDQGNVSQVLLRQVI